MSSNQDFVGFVLDQLTGPLAVSARKMFGEYALYCNGKLVAMVCDNQLFVKETAGGRAFLGEVTEAPPYPGAKPCFLIDEEIEQRDRLCELFAITERELPLPKPKSPKKASSGKRMEK